MAKLFGIPLKYKNKLDLANKFLDVYFIVKKPKDTMVEKTKKALAYFLVYGYTKENEKTLKEVLGVNSGYVRVIINMLKKNGYIITDNKSHKKRLSDEMLNCSKQLFEKQTRTFTIGFIK